MVRPSARPRSFCRRLRYTDGRRRRAVDAIGGDGARHVHPIERIDKIAHSRPYWNTLLHPRIKRLVPRRVQSGPVDGRSPLLADEPGILGLRNPEEPVEEGWLHLMAKAAERRGGRSPPAAVRCPEGHLFSLVEHLDRVPFVEVLERVASLVGFVPTEPVWKRPSGRPSRPPRSPSDGRRAASVRRLCRRMQSENQPRPLALQAPTFGGDDGVEFLDGAKRWNGFTSFLDDGRICLTNNAAERALRTETAVYLEQRIIISCSCGLRLAQQPRLALWQSSMRASACRVRSTNSAPLRIRMHLISLWIGR